jgi:trimethylguanosine synthase
MGRIHIVSGLVVLEEEIDFKPLPSGVSSSGRPHIGQRIEPRHWRRRYQLWSKFDCGIQMDEEAWFEVTPENIGKHIAMRTSGKEIIHDCCCGVGGNSVQFALNGQHVYSIDLNPSRLLMLRNNANIYGVCNMITPIHMDVLDYIQEQKQISPSSHAVFISPPWGGIPSYTKSRIGIDDLPINLRLIVPLAIKYFGALVLHLPKQMNLEEIMSIAREQNIRYIEVESVYYSHPVRHLKCHLVYIDSQISGRQSIFVGPRRFRLRSLLSLADGSRFGAAYTDWFLKVHYTGRYLLRALSSLRKFPAYLERVDFSKLSPAESSIMSDLIHDSKSNHK